jgi:putative acetyltransferase
MNKPTIRLLESKDFEQLHELYSEREAYSNTLQLPYQSVEHWQSKMARGGHTSLVAVRGDELLGQISIELHSSLRRRHVASIGMGVKASARSQGVGTALVRAAIDLCESWTNISRIELEVYTDNHAGIALYKKCGFVLEGTCRHYAFRDGAFVDVHIMARIKGENDDARRE